MYSYFSFPGELFFTLFLVELINTHSVFLFISSPIKCQVSKPQRSARHVFTAAGAQQEKTLFKKVYVVVSYMTRGAAGASDAGGFVFHHNGIGVLCWSEPQRVLWRGGE